MEMLMNLQSKELKGLVRDTEREIDDNEIIIRKGINSCCYGIKDLFYTLLNGGKLLYKKYGNKEIITMEDEKLTFSAVIDWETNIENWWLNGVLIDTNALGEKTYNDFKVIRNIAKKEKKDISVSMNEIRRTCKQYVYSWKHSSFIGDISLWGWKDKTYKGYADIEKPYENICELTRIGNTIFVYERKNESDVGLLRLHELSTREKVIYNRRESNDVYYLKTLFQTEK